MLDACLVLNDLLDRFQELLELTEDELNIISPFIGTQTAILLADWLDKNPEVECDINTRFYREDFIQRVSSIYGLERIHVGLVYNKGSLTFKLQFW